MFVLVGDVVARLWVSIVVIEVIAGQRVLYEGGGGQETHVKGTGGGGVTFVGVVTSVDRATLGVGLHGYVCGYIGDGVIWGGGGGV